MDGSERNRLREAAETIFVLCRGYGFDILRYPDNLGSYLKKIMPAGAAAADQCARALAVPGAVDGLMWCRYYAGDSVRLAACREDLADLACEGAPEEDAGAIVLALEALAEACVRDTGA